MVPENLKQLLGFIQTCSWFRCFVPSFAEIARPLTDLTKKGCPWFWGEPQQHAYDALKVALTTAPILRQPDYALPFVLKTDASAYALGGCLLQGEADEQRPIEYCSRLLNPAERNYSTTEREALAIVYSVGKFRGYIECSTILIQSDHQPLRWLMSLRTPTGRLARWALILQSYDLRIEYVPGKSNVLADMLSRPPIGEADVRLVAIDLPANNSNEVREDQLADEDIAQIIRGLESADNHREVQRWADRGYHMQSGVLY